MTVERGDSALSAASSSQLSNHLHERSDEISTADITAPDSGTQLEPSATLAPEVYAVGQMLAGKYRVERLIGEGAMGLVLAATHLGLDEVVAIKFMRAEVQRLPGTLSRFAKEAKIAARIRSEHVVKVIDVGVSEPIGPYIVMEYLEGRSLGELIEAEGPLAVQRAAEYLLQVCEGLAAAHAIGVTHRDIKPDNLYITRQSSIETVKVLDFGISKATLTGRVFGDDLALNQSCYLMGTPLYMSPEQIRADPNVDLRTDIWSLGAVFYELVSGKTAFSAESMTEICAKILETPAPALIQAWTPELRAAQAVIERCLEKDRSRRFQSVAELAESLLPLATERARAYAERSSNLLGSTRTSPLPIASLSSKPKRSSRRRVIALGASVLLGLGALAVLTRSRSIETLTRALVPIPSASDAAGEGRSRSSSSVASTVSLAPASTGVPVASTGSPRPSGDAEVMTRFDAPAAAKESSPTASGSSSSSALTAGAKTLSAAASDERQHAAQHRAKFAAPALEKPIELPAEQGSALDARPVETTLTSAHSRIRLVESPARMRLVAPPPLLPLRTNIPRDSK